MIIPDFFNWLLGNEPNILGIPIKNHSLSEVQNMDIKGFVLPILGEYSDSHFQKFIVELCICQEPNKMPDSLFKSCIFNKAFMLLQLNDSVEFSSFSSYLDMALRSFRAFDVANYFQILNTSYFKVTFTDRLGDSSESMIPLFSCFEEANYIQRNSMRDFIRKFYFEKESPNAISVIPLKSALVELQMCGVDNSQSWLPSWWIRERFDGYFGY
jgi:hypothetical protein